MINICAVDSVLGYCHDCTSFDCIASAAVFIADRQAGLFPASRRDLIMNTVTVAIDDSVAPGPGNWLELPESAVPAWVALSVEERRQVLAGRGSRLLINIIRERSPSEDEERGP